MPIHIILPLYKKNLFTQTSDFIGQSKTEQNIELILHLLIFIDWKWKLCNEMFLVLKHDNSHRIVNLEWKLKKSNIITHSTNKYMLLLKDWATSNSLVILGSIIPYDFHFGFYFSKMFYYHYYFVLKIKHQNQEKITVF